MLLHLTTVLYLALLCAFVSCRVLELDDRFREARKNGEWLVMFYAPWCGHCKQLEPTWLEIGDAMEGQMPVYVARLDCTKYSSLSSEFGVRGFPTIKYFAGDNDYEYRGARTKQDIIEFARKARGPKVTRLVSLEDIQDARTKHAVFFLYLGEENEELKKSYDTVAGKYFLAIQFYAATPGTFPSISTTPSIIVFKDDTWYEMPMVSDTVASPRQVGQWVSQEQVPDYSELNGMSYHEFKKTGRLYAVAVLPENNYESLDAMAKKIAISRSPLLHEKFVFCWVKGNAIINKMTYGTITTPNFVVFNPQNYEYYILHNEEASAKFDEQELRFFLSNVAEGNISPLGGSGFFQQVKRMILDFTNMIINFFRGSPIIASLVIGVPVFVVSSICYCLCTMEDVEEGDLDSEYDDDDEREDAEALPDYEADTDTSQLRRRHVDNASGDELHAREKGTSEADGETEKDK